MGCAKRAIEEYIEGNRQELTEEFIMNKKEAFDKFIEDNMQEMQEQFIEQYEQEFWDFCADQECDYDVGYDAYKEAQYVN
jgi:predicted transcriptional regulator